MDFNVFCAVAGVQDLSRVNKYAFAITIILVTGSTPKSVTMVWFDQIHNNIVSILSFPEH